MGDKTPNNFVMVKTTLPLSPLPSNDARVSLTTDRLLIRPLAASDLEAMYILRTQEEVMRWTSSGQIDMKIEETRDKLNNFLPPNDTKTFNCAICLKDAGEFIGMGGCHLFPASHGWPEVGYMLRREYWGQGLASEFLNAWLKAWEELSRSDREIRIQGDMATGNGEDVVREHLIAITEEANSGSQRVLMKAGFEKFREFDEGDVNDPTEVVKLIAFRYFPGGKTH